MVADLIQVLDDGTTIGDILYALGVVKNERARKRSSYKPTGNKVGRPRKTIQHTITGVDNISSEGV
jgi:hypothetical protein